MLLYYYIVFLVHLLLFCIIPYLIPARRNVSFNQTSDFRKRYKLDSIRSSKQSALAAHFSLTDGSGRGMRVSLTNIRDLSASYHPSRTRGWIGGTKNRISRAVYRSRETLITSLLVTDNVRFLFSDSREPEVG